MYEPVEARNRVLPKGCWAQTLVIVQPAHPVSPADSAPDYRVQMEESSSAMDVDMPDIASLSVDKEDDDSDGDASS